MTTATYLTMNGLGTNHDSQHGLTIPEKAKNLMRKKLLTLNLYTTNEFLKLYTSF